MNTKFRLDPCYEIEVTSDGSFPAGPGAVNAHCKGMVGVALHHTRLALLGSDQPPTETVFAAFMKPNDVRALASSMLAAAQSARGL